MEREHANDNEIVHIQASCACVCVCAHALPLSRVLDEVIKVVMATGSMGEVFA